jgi:hypothetical protein
MSYILQLKSDNPKNRHPLPCAFSRDGANEFIRKAKEEDCEYPQTPEFRELRAFALCIRQGSEWEMVLRSPMNGLPDKLIATAAGQ